MGKSEIIAHLGDGQYTVKLLRDRAWLDGRIAWADTRIAELQAERQPIADALDALLSERDDLQQELYDLIGQHSIENDLTGDIRQATVLLLRKREETSQIQAQLSRVDANLLSLEKRKQQLEAQAAAIEADTRAVWCADLTTTLTGEHPTLEVNGTSDHAILMPGTMPTEYTGDLAPVISMTVAQAAFNFAIHPGWQRWTPTFRVGTITALSVAQDTADVALDPAQGRYQGLAINEAETLTGVPVAYMTCNAAAFDVGDEVVVMLQGQDWADPVVIGFKEEPQPCECILVISTPSGDEAFAWDIAANEAITGIATFADIAAQFGTAAVQALPAGTYENRTEYPHESLIASGQSYSAITTLEGQSDMLCVVYPHKDSSLVGGPYWLSYRPLAFGENGDPSAGEDYNHNRRKWEHGDYVHVRTHAGSAELTIVEVFTENGVFNADYMWVPDANYAINQDWFFRVYTPPHGGNYRAVWAEGTGHSGTQDYGPALDYQYFMAENSGYPVAPNDAATGGHAAWLADAGLQYGIERGNYIDRDGTIHAPYVHYLEYRASSTVDTLSTLYTELTGVTPGEDVELQRHVRLYYMPMWGWDYYAAEIHNTMGHLESNVLGVEKIFDSWADCDISSTESVATVTGGLHVTAGEAQKGEYSIAYDAYSTVIDGEHQSGLHLYAKIPASAAMAPLELETLRLTNEERVYEGSHPLPFNMALQRAAQRHIDDMLAHWATYLEYFETTEEDTHEGTDGTTPNQRAGLEGYANHWKMYLSEYIPQAFENTAVVIPPEGWDGSMDVIASYFIQGWMESEGHRENLLNIWHDDVGIACGQAPDGKYVAVQLFGRVLGRPDGYFSVTEDATYMENVSGWLKGFIDDNFTWAGEGDESRLPAIYLI